MSEKSSNFNQALWLGIGQLCTFALSFVSAAILSRYFDKTEYGTYKQILYVYNTLSTLFIVGLPNVFSYFIPRLNTGQQKTLIASINRIFLISGALFSLALFFSADLIARLLNNPELATGIRIFSPFPLFTLPTMGVEGIYTALRKTKFIAIYQVLSKILMLICIVGPVILFHTGYREAIIGWGIASFIIFLIAMYMKSKPYFHIKKEVIENFYKQVFDYCLPLVGAFIAGFFISSADQFFISRYWGTETFAEASNGCLSIPIAGMIAGSIRAVLIPLFSKADSEGSMGNAIHTYNSAVNKCVTLVFPILLFCAFFANEIMVFIYGAQYDASGSYMRVFIVRDFLSCLPYFSVLMAIGSTRFYMIMHVIGVFFIWGFDFLIASVGLPPTLFVAVNSGFHLLMSIAAFVFIYKKTSVNLINKSVLLNMLKITLHCSVILFIILNVSRISFSSLPVIFSIIISGISFYGLILITSRIIKVDYLESFKLLLKR